MSHDIVADRFADERADRDVLLLQIEWVRDKLLKLEGALTKCLDNPDGGHKYSLQENLHYARTNLRTIAHALAPDHPILKRFYTSDPGG